MYECLYTLLIMEIEPALPYRVPGSELDGLFVVRWGFLTRTSRFLGFFKELDILTRLWQGFFCVPVCIKIMRLYNRN